MTTHRWTLAAGSAGLIAGLALGVTSLASAADPTPSPKAGSNTQPPPGHRPHGPGGLEHERAGGLVSAVSGGSLTVRTPMGTKTVALNGSTTYYQGQTKTTLAAIKVGDVVHVRLVDPQATAPVAAVVTVVPAHVAGWVTKIDGSTITLVDGSGFTRTLTTSGTTTYRKDGATGSASDITVGTFVHALGAVDQNGTTLDATEVGVGFPAMGGRPGPDNGPADTPGPQGGPDDSSAT